MRISAFVAIDQQKLEALLLEGLNSGDPIEITPEYWENKRPQLLERHARKLATPLTESVR